MKSRPIRQHKGFALVIALMLMSFVTLILLSFSTLTQAGLHSANLEAKRFVARSNAQFALMQAIGKLQRMTGPDQRITASANIINTSGVYAEDRATEKRHWVGAWNTQELNESNDLQTQGRNTGSIDIYTDSFQGWLVSDGASPETIDSLSSILSGYDDENETSLVALLGENSVLFQGSDDPTREGVYLLKSPIGDEGNYAFWVSDESLKANFSLEDPFQDAAANSIEKRYGQIISQSPNASLGIDESANMGGLNFVASEKFDLTQLPRLGAQVDLSPAAKTGADKSEVSEATRSTFHHLSNATFGVFSDVRNGGLKKDLSLAMEISDTDFQETDFINSDEVNTAGSWKQTLNGSEMLLGYLYQQETEEVLNGDEVTLRGPTWQLLRSFYRSYRDITQRTSSPAIAASVHRPNLIDASQSQLSTLQAIPFQGQKNGVGHGYSWQAERNTSGDPVLRNTATQRTPILTNAKYIFGLQRVHRGGERVLSLSLNFVATVMNPYNVALEFQGYQLMLHALPVVVSVEKYAPGEIIPSNNTIKKELREDPDYGPYLLEYILRKEVDGMGSTQNSGAVVSGEMGEPIFGNFILTEVDSNGDAMTNGSAKVRLEPGEIKVISLANENPTMDSEIGLPATFTFNDQGGFRYTQLGFPDMYLGHSELEKNPEGPDPDDPLEVDYPVDHPSNYIPLTNDERVVVMLSSKVGGYWQDYMMYINTNNNNVATREGQLFFNQMLIDESGDLSEALESMSMPRGLWAQSLRLSMSANQLNDDFEITQVYTGSELDTQRFIAATNVTLKAVDDDTSPGPYMANFNMRMLTGRDLNVLNKGDGIGPPQYIVTNESLVATAINYPIKGGEEYNGAWGSSNSSTGESRVILYDVPTTPILSIGSLQHADIGTMADQPNYSVGYSYPSPFIARDQVWESVYGGNDYVFADTAYLANESLWDRFYFSSLSGMDAFDLSSVPSDAQFDSALDNEIEDFISAEKPLPNTNFISVPRQNLSLSEVIAEVMDRSTGYDRLASNALMRGAFNVNSTSVPAWKALLSSLLSDNALTYTDSDGQVQETSISSDAIFTRTVLPGGDESNNDVWVGVHGISDTQLTDLAQGIVEEVKLRGPFTSMSDFVNRRLNDGETGKKGTIQAAIDDRTTIQDANLSSMGSMPSDDLEDTFQKPFPYMEHFLEDSAAGGPGYLLQGDVLTAIGPYLTARGDTFLIRAYGDVINPITDRVEARAWCEAIVQRMPDFVAPAEDAPHHDVYDAEGNPSLNSNENQQFGRGYRIIRFRWLENDEV